MSVSTGPVADPDLERRGGFPVFCPLPCRLFLLLRFYFLTKIMGGGGGSPGIDLSCLVVATFGDSSLKNMSVYYSISLLIGSYLIGLLITCFGYEPRNKLGAANVNAPKIVKPHRSYLYFAFFCRSKRVLRDRKLL